MKFSDFLLKESVDDEVLKATGNFDVFHFDEDTENEEELDKFIKSLRDKGIYLGKDSKDSSPMYRIFDDAEFGKEVQDDGEFDWNKFVGAVKKLFREFGKEVAMSGKFKVGGKEYKFDARGDSPEDAEIYFDNQ